LSGSGEKVAYFTFCHHHPIGNIFQKAENATLSAENRKKLCALFNLLVELCGYFLKIWCTKSKENGAFGGRILY